MSADHPVAGLRRRGPGAMIGIVWRTQRRSILVWVVSLGASLIGTAAAVAGVYDTPDKIHTYAAAVTSGSALPSSLATTRPCRRMMAARYPANWS